MPLQCCSHCNTACDCPWLSCTLSSSFNGQQPYTSAPFTDADQGLLLAALFSALTMELACHPATMVCDPKCARQSPVLTRGVRLQLLSALTKEPACTGSSSGAGMPQRCCALASVLAAKRCHCGFSAPHANVAKLSGGA